MHQHPLTHTFFQWALLSSPLPQATELCFFVCVTLVLFVCFLCGGTSVFGTAHIMSLRVSAFVMLGVIYAYATVCEAWVSVGGVCVWGGGLVFEHFMHCV